jgi:hypothetical protein
MKPTKRRVSSSTSIQAPTGGLNAKDAYASMKPTEAIELENYFPTPSSVDIRRGSTNHVTGFAEKVETLAAYISSSSSKLFAAAGDSIYDATTAGAVGSAAVSSLTNARWQHINMGTAGGHFLLMVNGEDKMHVYNGSSWYADGTTTTVTGVDTADCIHINNFKNRVWLIEKDTFNAWYLPVASIGGAANNLDLSGLFKLGGYLMVMANWTIDNAAGVDDYAAFITSEGEVALYKGTDPSSATTWALVGTFRMGSPIGRRCFIKAGADVLVLTTDGAFPLSKALLTDRSQQNLAATDKIRNLINSDVSQYKLNYGWQPILHPAGQKLILNIPATEDIESKQYVMNTDSKAWCLFTGWNAICFETLGDRLFFGTQSAVLEADIGFEDNGAEITAVCQQAFSYFGNPGTQKHFKMARTVLFSEAEISPAIKMNVDYRLDRTQTAGSFVGNTGSLWDAPDWDDGEWSSGATITHRWLSVTGVGYTGGLRLVLSIKGFDVKWQSTDFVYENGQVL